MKVNKNHKITLLSTIGILFVLLIAVSFKEGLDNPLASTIKCVEKGLKCDTDLTCCEGMKCLGKECK